MTGRTSLLATSEATTARRTGLACWTASRRLSARSLCRIVDRKSMFRETGCGVRYRPSLYSCAADAAAGPPASSKGFASTAKRVVCRCSGGVAQGSRETR